MAPCAGVRGVRGSEKGVFCAREPRHRQIIRTKVEYSWPLPSLTLLNVPSTALHRQVRPISTQL